MQHCIGTATGENYHCDPVKGMVYQATPALQKTRTHMPTEMDLAMFCCEACGQTALVSVLS